MSDNDFTPPLRVFESGHILKYLAEKYGKFIPEDPRERVECFNWLFWLQVRYIFFIDLLGFLARKGTLRVVLALSSPAHIVVLHNNNNTS